MSAFLKKTGEFVVGLSVIAGVVYVVAGVFDRRADAGAMAEDLTLAGYAALAPEARLERVTAAAAGVDAIERADDFTVCMGEFAATKSPDLPFNEVFGWCDLERTSNPDAFADHFNELDAEDLSITALTVCETMVRNGLRSPSTADFVFVEPIPRGRQRYLVSSYVDAENAVGAMVRARYVCEIQHDGVGDPLQLASWTTHQMVLE